MTHKTEQNSADALQQVVKAAEQVHNEKGLPPVHLWEPDYCGDIGMKIAANGQWFYAGSPIGRAALVRLFSTILRHDEDGEHYLVTPAEKIRIEVEDAPFIATLLHVEGQGKTQILRFETNVGDFTAAGAAHALRFMVDEHTAEPRPYIHVRARLEALISRSVFYQLVDYAVHYEGNFGLWSGGVFFPIMPSTALEDIYNE